MKTELYYTERTNALRILHPDGNVETLYLDTNPEEGWFLNTYTKVDVMYYKSYLKAFSELICIIEESV